MHIEQLQFGTIANNIIQMGTTNIMSSAQPVSCSCAKWIDLFRTSGKSFYANVVYQPIFFYLWKYK